MIMTPTQYWLIGAVVLFILEVLTPGFVLANFGVACLFSAIAAWMGAGIAVQVVVFCVAALGSFFTVRPFMNKVAFSKHQSVPMNTEALIGRKVLVTDPILHNHNGRVKVDSDSWSARTEDGAEIQSGVQVIITSVDSTTLIVTKA